VGWAGLLVVRGDPGLECLPKLKELTMGVLAPSTGLVCSPSKPRTQASQGGGGRGCPAGLLLFAGPLCYSLPVVICAGLQHVPEHNEWEMASISYLCELQLYLDSFLKFC